MALYLIENIQASNPRISLTHIKAKKNAPDPLGLEQIFVVKKNPVAEKSMSL
jgi:hypothetical protein